MANCLNWKSEEVEMLAKQVGVENTPAFADKLGTLMDNLGIEDSSILPTLSQVKEYLKSTEENLAKLRSLRAGGNPLSGLKHAEVMLPAWSKKLFEGFTDKNGNLDFDKINKELPEILEMIGYRIPTEDKYSMLPLKVIGFMPFQSGGSVVLPSEITTISGSDFDIDKLYIMMKNFIKKGGKYQVEKYLDESNSTVEERKLAYAKRTDEGKKITLEYKEKIANVNDKLKQLKALTIDEIGEELDFLESDVNDAKNGLITDFQVDGSAVSKEEYISELQKEISDLYKQLDVLHSKSTEEVDNNNIKEINLLKESRTNLKQELNDKLLSVISDEDFNKISIPDQNTKGARDNRKLDMMTSVLQHETTTGDIMNPGGFAMLEKVASTIDKLKGVKNKFNSLFDEMSLDAITIQNITGKPLVGIAANHNAHAALRQHYNLNLKKPIIFDDNKLINLSAKDGVSGKITRNLAEILAAIVDNAKDPLAEKLNYNEHTADFVSLLIGVGVPLETSFAFINHPTILEAMKKLAQGDANSLQDGLKLVMKDLGIKHDKKEDVKNIKTSELLSAIGKPLKSNASLNKDVLTNAMEYLTMSKALGDLIRASKADTGGITQSIEGGQATLDLIKKIIDDEEFAIDGVVEFLEGTSDEMQTYTSNDTTIKEGVDFVFEQSPELSEIGNQQQYSEYIETIFPESKVNKILYKGIRKYSSSHKFESEPTFFTDNLPTAESYFINEVSESDKWEMSISQELLDSNLNIEDEPLTASERSKLQSVVDDIKTKMSESGSVISVLVDSRSISEFKDASEFKEDLNIQFEELRSIKSSGFDTAVVTDSFDTMFGGYSGRAGINAANVEYYEKYIGNTYIIFEPEQIHILGSKSDIDGFKKFVEKSKPSTNKFKPSFVKSFTENGIKKPIERVMNNMFPYGNELFNLVKDTINSMAMYPLSKDERESVNRDFIAFMTTNLPYYTTSTFKGQVVPVDRIKLIKELPKMIQNIKLKYPELIDQDSDSYNKLLTVLKIDFDKKMEMDVLSFNNTATSTEEQLNEIRNAWSSMFDSNAQDGTLEYELDRIANHLLRYSFWTSGHNFTPNSLGKLIPIDNYMGIKDESGFGVVSKVNSLLKGTTIDNVSLNTFVEQFIRNNAFNVKLAPRILDDLSNVTSVNNNNVVINANVKRDSNLVMYDSETKQYSGVPYISFKDKSGLRLYKYSGSDNGIVTFTRIGLLGSRTLREYDINSLDIDSAVNKNNYPVSEGRGAGEKGGEALNRVSPETNVGLATKDVNELLDNQCKIG